MEYEQMTKTLEELQGILQEVGDDNFTEVLKQKGIDVDAVMLLSLSVAVSLDRDINVRDWTLSFCIAYMLGYEVALRDMGRETFGGKEEEA